MVPTRVLPLHELVWDGQLNVSLPSRAEVRAWVRAQIALLREDHLRPINPTPYKVSLSEPLYAYLHNLWMRQAPIEVVK